MRIFRHLTANEVKLEPFPFRRELTMGAYLIENEQVLSLDPELFSSVQVISAEMSVKEGRGSKGTDGRVDIVATYNDEHLAVIELKAGELKYSHLKQLQDYLEQSEQLKERYAEIIDKEVSSSLTFVGVLVGSSIDPSLAAELRAGCSHCNIPIAALTVERFRGVDGSVFVTTDVFFKPPNGRDWTRYRFDGSVYGKGRLVLAILRRYVGAHPNIKFSELEKVFPRSLQGSSGVFATLERANEVFTERGYKRHFIADDEVIQLADSTIAVSNQWGIGNIPKLLAVASKHGFEVVIDQSNES